MKKILFFLFLAMTIPTTMRAQTEINGIYYNLNSSARTAEVTRGSSEYTNSVTIPSSVTYNGVQYSVTSIGDYAFSYCSGLTSIAIPNSVTSIGYYTFFGCSGLISIIVDTDNPKYDSRNNCNAIVETASNTLIAGCMNTVIPNNVWSIGWGTFYGCSGLTSIDIPNSVTSIGDYAFYECIGLTSIDIPNSVTNIGDYAFYECIGLSTVAIPNSVKRIGAEAFSECSGLESIDIANGVEEISYYAFSHCTNLTSVFIPSSVRLIDCDTYTFYFDNMIVEDISLSNPFAGCTNLISIKVDESNPYYDSRDNCNAIIEKSSNTLITGCYKTVIPSDVKAIRGAAFRDCDNLESISIPNSVTYIGPYAFSSCSNLNSITLSNSLDSICPYTFVYCKKLETITIPSSVKRIGMSSFLHCDNLSFVDILGNVEIIEPQCFSNCSSLTIINLPNSVKKIQQYAFSSCKSLTSITLPNQLKSIGRGAFNNCNALTSITIPNSVASIGDYAFSSGFALTDVTNLSTTPQEITLQTFTNYGTLHVLPGCKSLYQAAENWNRFNIVEDAVDGIEETPFETENGEIKVVDVYDFNGKRLSGQQPGINILRMSDGTTRKVVVK